MFLCISLHGHAHHPVTHAQHIVFRLSFLFLHLSQKAANEPDAAPQSYDDA